MDILACNSANKPSFHVFEIQQKAFFPMLHRCKMCSDIFKVASVIKMLLHFLHSMEHWAKETFSDFEKVVY